MNNETRLLSRAITDRSINLLFERGVQDTWFVDSDNLRVWKFVREHFFSYAEVPSLEVIQSNFPSYKPIEVNDSIEYLIDAVMAEQIGRAHV